MKETPEQKVLRVETAVAETALREFVKKLEEGAERYRHDHRKADHGLYLSAGFLKAVEYAKSLLTQAPTVKEVKDD